MPRIRSILIVLWFCAGSLVSPTWAEEHTEAVPVAETEDEVHSDALVSPRALYASIFNQSVGLAVGGGLLGGLVKPGLLVGAEHTWVEFRRARWFQTAGGGYLRQRWVQHGVLLQTETGSSLRLVRDFHGELLLGLGYFHSFSERPIYDPATGRQQRDLGKPSVMPSVSMGLAWSQQWMGASPYGIFVRQQFLLQAPFAPGIGATVIPHTAFHFGIRYGMQP